MLPEHIIMYISIYFGLFMATYFLIVFFTENRRDPELGKLNKKLPFVSVIIPAYNESKVIEKTIDCCLKINYPKNKIEIIVVDDGSTDNTYEVANRIKDSRIKVFRKQNGGKGSAMNFGIKKAKGEFIASLDAESFVSSHALKKMLGYFNDEKVVTVTPALNIYNPKGFILNLQYAEYAMGIFLRKTFGVADAIHVVPGPFSIYRAIFFKKYGGFEENNITEDTELGLRIQSKGYKIKNSMEADVYTVAPSSFSALFKQRIRWYYGFTKNAWNYKMLFSPKYGDLGIAVLPAAVLSILLTIVLFMYFLYKNAMFLSDSLVKLQVLNVNIIDALVHSDLRYVKGFFESMISNPFIAFIVVSAVILAIYVFVAKKSMKNKNSMIIAYVYFFLAYWAIFPFWWLSLFVYKVILRKKIKWGKKLY